MLKVIYDTFSFTFCDLVITRLLDRHQWYPKLILTGNTQFLTKSFPDSNVIDHFEARRGYYDYNFKNLRPLDKVVLSRASCYESNFYDILDRDDPTGSNFTWSQRSSLFRKQIEFWYNYILENEIDLIISWVLPHSIDSYSLYIVSRLLSVKTLMFDNAPIFGGYYYCTTSIENRASVFQLKNFKSKDEDLAQGIKSYLTKINGEYDACVPSYMKVRWGVKDSERIKILVGQFIKMFLTFGLFSKARTKFKSKKSKLDLSKTDFTNIGYYFFKNSSIFKNFFIRRNYSKICEPFDPNIDYVYFSANYQPEATTTPGAGRYSDHLTVLKMLSSAVPSGTIIYYKEHPSTFWWFAESFLCRNKDFYNEIIELGNVKFISHEINTFSLIDNSLAVSCISGTVAWESVVRGKPCISFGSSWYDGCSEIFNVIDHESLRDYITRIVNGFEIDYSKIIEYAHIIQEVANDRLHLHGYEQKVKEGLSTKVHADYIADSYYETFINNYSD